MALDPFERHKTSGTNNCHKLRKEPSLRPVVFWLYSPLRQASYVVATRPNDNLLIWKRRQRNKAARTTNGAPSSAELLENSSALR